MNKVARYWLYDGNHPNGRDCERYDPNGFGLSLIVAMANWGDADLPVIQPLTVDDVAKIKVTHHKPKDSFGHEITVSAPNDVWLKAQQALANFLAKYAIG